MSRIVPLLLLVELLLAVFAATIVLAHTGMRPETKARRRYVS
jgi:hypothetical protein